DTQAGFASRVVGKNAKGKQVARYLKGVPPTAVTMISALQPYAGCTWTKDLRELSNPDKHRHLAALRSHMDATIKRSEVTSFDPETGKGALGIYYDAEVEVFFADDRPVLETLQMLCIEVEAVTDEELVGNGEADVTDRELVDEAAVGAVEERRDRERRRRPELERAAEVVEGEPGVDHVLHDDYVPTGDVAVEVLQQAD